MSSGPISLPSASVAIWPERMRSFLSARSMLATCEYRPGGGAGTPAGLSNVVDMLARLWAMPAARQANVSHGCHAKFACHGYLPAGRLPRGGRTRLVHRRGCGARLTPVRGVAAGLRAGERVRGVPVRPAAAWRAADRVRAEPAACRYGCCFNAG